VRERERGGGGDRQSGREKGGEREGERGLLFFEKGGGKQRVCVCER
jgi:hypothetical protein